jgi:uncharacterized protein YdeI (YjbR/CyaY-like superfamily)
MPEQRDAVFFRTPADWRAWLQAHAADGTELWVGFFKRGAGETGITWPEAVDQALCFGWIDGRRQSIDDARYRIRFTPRKPSSIWSAVNVARVEELGGQGLMQPAGLEAFARRRAERSGIYSHEQAAEPELDAAQEARFRERPEAWDYFHTQAPSYRKAALWWVVNAKRAETRERRLATLIADSAAGRRVGHLQRPGSRA